MKQFWSTVEQCKKLTCFELDVSSAQEEDFGTKALKKLVDTLATFPRLRMTRFASQPFAEDFRLSEEFLVDLMNRCGGLEVRFPS